MKKLSELRTIAPELNVKFIKNKKLMEVAKEIKEKREMEDLIENAHNNTKAVDKRHAMFNAPSKLMSPAKLLEVEILSRKNMTEQNIVAVLFSILEMAVPEKNRDLEKINKVANYMVESLGKEFFFKTKSNTFKYIIEAASESTDSLEDMADDINTVAKVVQAKVKSAINNEKENVIAMQEKTNEMIEENKYKDPDEEAPETEDEGTDNEDETSDNTDEGENTGLDSSMDEYDKSVKESFFDKMFGNMLKESLGDDYEDEEENDCDYDSDYEDDEYDENFADLNDDLIDDLDLDELETELDKLNLDDDMYSTDDLTEEEKAEINDASDVQDDEIFEEQARFTRDSKYNLLVNDKFKTKVNERKTLIESLLISLSPKYLSEAEGSAINETNLLNDTVLSYTVLEMLNTVKLVDFSNGKLDKFKNNITKW